MKDKETITVPLVSPVIDEKTKRQLKVFSKEENQVVVHCRFVGNPFGGDCVRIWKSTYLLPKNSSHKCKLVHAENISIAPQWTIVQASREFTFTLIFTGLPKGCRIFDLVENIPEPNGFIINGIARNHSDVYTINL